MPGKKCKELCKVIQAKKIGFSTSPYVEGLKKCMVCTVYLKTDSKHCPCCNCLLRTRARSKKTKIFAAKILGNRNYVNHQGVWE
jgi:predicted nucleic acid-binding Zn ribbon protein